MLHITLDAHMQIRYGIESKENKANCDKCHLKEELRKKPYEEKTEKEKKMKPVCSCHCKFANCAYLCSFDVAIIMLEDFPLLLLSNQKLYNPIFLKRKLR